MSWRFFICRRWILTLSESITTILLLHIHEHTNAYIVGAAVSLTFAASHIRDQKLSCTLDQSTIHLPPSMHLLSFDLPISPTCTSAVIATMYQCWRHGSTISSQTQQSMGINDVEEEGEELRYRGQIEILVNSKLERVIKIMRMVGMESKSTTWEMDVWSKKSKWGTDNKRGTWSVKRKNEDWCC